MTRTDKQVLVVVLAATGIGAGLIALGWWLSR